MTAVKGSAGAAAYAAELTDAFEAALQAFVGGLPDHRELISYAVCDGHRTRPVGCLLSCAAAGGDWRGALGVAVAVELLHKSSVIRDDICDGDEVRGGRPAFHVAFDVARAIAVSDRLLTLGLVRVAHGAPASVSERCSHAAAQVLHEMAAGQLEDIDPSAHRHTTQDRLDVSDAKTGSLAGLACRLGATVAHGETAHVEALDRYGRRLGTAFQVLNDVRNLNGEELEREAGSDVRDRRDTVLTAFSRERASDASGDFSRRPTGGDDAPFGERERLLAAGAVSHGEAVAARLLEDARRELCVLPPTPASLILEALTLGLLREHAF